MMTIFAISVALVAAFAGVRIVCRGGLHIGPAATFSIAQHKPEPLA
jgi:hypothetical protein